MAPSAKKQKVRRENDDVVDVTMEHTSDPTPIIFNVHGHDPDIRLFVFNRVFHVHSNRLKTAALFFDVKPERKEDTGEPESVVKLHFQKEYFTKLDNIHGWVLTDNPQCKGDDLSAFTGSNILEETVFHYFLCAIFCKRYTIRDGAELIQLAKQAQYYRADDAVSISIDGLLHTSQMIGAISKSPDTIIIAAYTLKHEKLFKECFLHVLGPWSSPRYPSIQHPQLRSLARKAHIMITNKIVSVHMQLLEIGVLFPPPRDKKKNSGPTIGAKIMDLTPECIADEDGKLKLPLWFRTCFEEDYTECSNPEGQVELEKILRPVLLSNLKLNVRAEPGKGEFVDHFLFFEVSNLDLPWPVEVLVRR